MPKGLVVYLDDDTYKKLKEMYSNPEQSLRGVFYDIIKDIADKYEEFLVEKQKDGERHLNIA